MSIFFGTDNTGYKITHLLNNTSLFTAKEGPGIDTIYHSRQRVMVYTVLTLTKTSSVTLGGVDYNIFTNASLGPLLASMRDTNSTFGVVITPGFTTIPFSAYDYPTTNSLVINTNFSTSTTIHLLTFTDFLNIGTLINSSINMDRSSIIVDGIDIASLRYIVPGTINTQDPSITIGSASYQLVNWFTKTGDLEIIANSTTTAVKKQGHVVLGGGKTPLYATTSTQSIITTIDLGAPGTINRSFNVGDLATIKVILNHYNTTTFTPPKLQVATIINTANNVGTTTLHYHFPFFTLASVSNGVLTIGCGFLPIAPPGTLGGVDIDIIVSSFNA